MGGDWKEMFRGVETNDFEWVKYNIAKGIVINYQHPEFLTSPLVDSIKRNHYEMMVFFLLNRADPSIKEAESYKSPMTIAKEVRNKKAVEILNVNLNTTEVLEKDKPQHP